MKFIKCVARKCAMSVQARQLMAYVAPVLVLAVLHVEIRGQLLYSGLTIDTSSFASIVLLLVFLSFGLTIVDLHNSEKFLGRSAGFYVAAGVLLSLVYHQTSMGFYVFCFLLACYNVYKLLTCQCDRVFRLFYAMSVLYLMYSVIFFMNYRALQYVGGATFDQIFVDIDTHLYGLVLGAPAYEGIFPLVKNPFIVYMLENAYMTLFLEIFVCFMFMLGRGVQGKFIFILFVAYVGGVVCFCLFPVFEPYLLQPNCMDQCMKESLALRVVGGLRQEFFSVLNHGQINGLGYFVGFPSLHVAVVYILQYFFSVSKSYFLFFLPINIMIVISTVFLGFHYLLDVPAGFVLAIISIWIYDIYKYLVGVIVHRFLGNEARLNPGL